MNCNYSPQRHTTARMQEVEQRKEQLPREHRDLCILSGLLKKARNLHGTACC